MKVLILLLFISSQCFGESWNDQHDPAALLISYENELGKLPLQGKLNQVPWSGDYWPTYRGGASYRWLYPGSKDHPQKISYKLLDMNNLGRLNIQYLSPTEKFDLYIGDKDWSLTNYERERTGILKTVKGSPVYDKKFKIEKWWGLCHNWAPATLLYQNPGPIVLKGKNGQKIPFGSGDIQALLLIHMEIFNERLEKGLINRPEYYQEQFLGDRCDISLKMLWEQLEKKEITNKEFVKQINQEKCTGPNAGSFHLALANLIGIKKMGFVMDMDRFDEVWNQGIYSYQSAMGPPKLFRDRKNKFKPTRKRKVTTKVTYIGEVDSTYEKSINPKQFKDVIYKYEIHTDKNDKIVGGRWLGRKKAKDRPDFLWMSKMPYFRYGLADMQEIYFESTGQKIGRKAYSKSQLRSLFKKAIKDIRTQLKVSKKWKGTKGYIGRRKQKRKGFFARMKSNFKKFAARFK